MMSKSSHHPNIHYDLLRFCQHTRLNFLGRSLPPEVMMTSTNGVFSSEVCQEPPINNTSLRDVSMSALTAKHTNRADLHWG